MKRRQFIKGLLSTPVIGLASYSIVANSNQMDEIVRLASNRSADPIVIGPNMTATEVLRRNEEYFKKLSSDDDFLPDLKVEKFIKRTVKKYD